jgi:hypothetical protein
VPSNASNPVRGSDPVDDPVVEEGGELAIVEVPELVVEDATGVLELLLDDDEDEDELEPELELDPDPWPDPDPEFEPEDFLPFEPASGSVYC